MNYYQDKWGRFHHKPCKNGEPGGNNGWLFTAYAVKVGLTIDLQKLKECWRACHLIQEDRNPILLRSPGKYGPPFSRDEFLGMSYLFGANEMRNYHAFHGWIFSPYPLPKFSATKLLKQLWELRPTYELKEWDGDVINAEKYEWKFKHRNYFWENELSQLYRFAFSVPVQDRNFILKTWGKFSWRKPSHIFYAAVAFIDSKLGASGIRFLKYGGEKNKAEMVKEFPEDHPIYKKVWNR